MCGSSQIRVDPKACPSTHSLRNKMGRLLWGMVWGLLFRPSPWFWHGGRRWLLRCFGARVGRGAQIMPSVRIWVPWHLELGEYATVSHGVDLYCVDKIRIKDHATISQRAFICTATHAIDHPHMPLVTAPIVVACGAWVCAEAFVHPGVAIGVDAVVAARAVVTRSVADGAVVAGNPARFLRQRQVAPGHPPVPAPERR
jgi:putative colanic acid biosynthesis acetyltransferase WcaF